MTDSSSRVRKKQSINEILLPRHRNNDEALNRDYKVNKKKKDIDKKWKLRNFSITRGKINLITANEYKRAHISFFCFTAIRI